MRHGLVQRQMVRGERRIVWFGEKRGIYHRRREHVRRRRREQA